MAPNPHLDASPYPTYHTGYETFYLVDNFIDPGFKTHSTCSKLSIHMLLNLAESAFLPLSPRHIVTEIRRGVDGMREQKFPQTLRENGAGDAFDLMLSAIEDFNSSASSWVQFRNKMKKESKSLSPLK